MRPLTETMPKPLLPLLDRRSLDHVLDHLARHGVHEVVLSSPYLEATFHPFIEARARRPVHHLDHRDRAAGHRRRHRERARPARRRAVLRAERRHPHRPRPHGDARARTVSETPPSRSRCTTSRTRARSGWSRRSRTAASCAFREKPRGLGSPATSTPARTCSTRAVLARLAAGDAALDRTRHLPGGHRGGPPRLRLLAEAYWLDLGTPEKYLQAHFDMMRGQGARRVLPGALGRATGADVDLRAHLGRWVAVGAAAPRSAPTPRSTTRCSSRTPGGRGRQGASARSSGPGRRSGGGATVSDSVLGEGALGAATRPRRADRLPSGSRPGRRRTSLDLAARGGAPARRIRWTAVAEDDVIAYRLDPGVIRPHASHTRPRARSSLSIGSASSPPRPALAAPGHHRGRRRRRRSADAPRPAALGGRVHLLRLWRRPRARDVAVGRVRAGAGGMGLPEDPDPFLLRDEGRQGREPREEHPGRAHVRPHLDPPHGAGRPREAFGGSPGAQGGTRCGKIPVGADLDA